MRNFRIAPGTEQPAPSALAEWRARHVCSSATDKSRVATINSAYSISHGVVSKQIYLTQYGLMAERHWREFRPKMVRELEAKGHLNGSSVRGAGENDRRNGSADAEIGNGTEADSAAGARSGLGDDSGEIHSSAAGRESLNANNYRIRPEDALGRGSLKQKCRDNFAAIELAHRLDAEAREATEDEKRVLVKYVGWGGIPQVFADQTSSEWASERERLKELLTAEEYESARASTLNAHYTSATVISAIYDAVQRLGFEHGRVLEPALGVGHFFGLMPAEMQARSQLTGVEIDPLSASIARKLYPGADIRTQGFEAAVLPHDWFDLAVSNVPFGDYKLHDPEFNEHNFLIHDYFFAKAIAKVRPGGLVVFVTSKGTLDKVNSHLRAYLSDKADFLGAIRLPNNAFKRNANTEVTTDIVFLRRLAAGERPSGPTWLNLAEHANRDGAVFQINEYFAANPHMMLGHMANAGTMYRSNEPALVADDRDLSAALAEAVAALPRRNLPQRGAKHLRAAKSRDNHRAGRREGKRLHVARWRHRDPHGFHADADLQSARRNGAPNSRTDQSPQRRPRSAAHATG